MREDFADAGAGGYWAAVQKWHNSYTFCLPILTGADFVIASSEAAFFM